MKFALAQKILVFSVVFVTLTPLAGCKKGVDGTYGDPNSGTFIVLKSGGKATFTAMNQPGECTYTAEDKTITLDCKDGSPVVMTLSDDGTTLNMPAGSLMPNMKKTK